MNELPDLPTAASAASAAVELFSRGGVLMIPLLLCSIVAIAVVLERLVHLRRSRVLAPEPCSVLGTLDAGDEAEIHALAQPDRGPIARLLNVALDHQETPRDLLTEAVRDTGRREVQRLEEHLGLLAMVGGVAPLFGLLGTVLGMIRAFDALYLGGMGGTADPALLAHGISEALFSTGAGLGVAIPALLAHHLFLGRVDRLSTDIEEAAIEIVRRVARRGPGETAGAMPSAEGDDAHLPRIGPTGATRAAS